MPRKTRIKKIVVRIGSELKEKLSESKSELTKEATKKTTEIKKGEEKGMLVERFIIPILKQPLQSLSFQPMPLQPLPPESKFSDVSIHELKQLLTDEKARVLATVKLKKPVSLYHLAKLVSRDFKAVRDDVKILEKFGLIKLVAEKDKGKKRLKPILALDKLEVTIEV